MWTFRLVAISDHYHHFDMQILEDLLGRFLLRALPILEALGVDHADPGYAQVYRVVPVFAFLFLLLARAAYLSLGRVKSSVGDEQISCVDYPSLNFGCLFLLYLATELVDREQYPRGVHLDPQLEITLYLVVILEHCNLAFTC